MSSLFRRLEALEAQTQALGFDLSPDAQAATVQRLLERMEAWAARQAEILTPEEREAAEQAEEAAYWRDREANPASLVDVGCRFTMRAAIEAALQRRNTWPAEDDAGVTTGTLVPSICGPQEDVLAVNAPAAKPPAGSPKPYRKPVDKLREYRGDPHVFYEPKVV